MTAPNPTPVTSRTRAVNQHMYRRTLTFLDWHLRRTKGKAMKAIAERETQPTNEPTVAGIVQRRALGNAEDPMTVREAARFLGVSRQTV
jgi:hypothetical protein